MARILCRTSADAKTRFGTLAGRRLTVLRMLGAPGSRGRVEFLYPSRPALRRPVGGARVFKTVPRGVKIETARDLLRNRAV